VCNTFMRSPKIGHPCWPAMLLNAFREACARGDLASAKTMVSAGDPSDQIASWRMDAFWDPARVEQLKSWSSTRDAWITAVVFACSRGWGKIPLLP
jgi:hypothetical protein